MLNVLFSTTPKVAAGSLVNFVFDLMEFTRDVLGHEVYQMGKESHTATHAFIIFSGAECGDEINKMRKLGIPVLELSNHNYHMCSIEIQKFLDRIEAKRIHDA